MTLALLVATGCGRNSQQEPARTQQPEAPPAAPAAVTPPVRDARPAILALGDSLTAGFGVAAGMSYPDFLQKELDRRGLAWRVVNGGVSGDTSAGGLSRLGHLLASKPEFAIVALGGNDGLRGLPLTATRANLEQIIVTLKGAGARVILAGITLPPNYGADYIRSFEQMYRDLSAAHKLPLIPFLLEGAWPRHMLPDGIHANAQGNQIVAGLVLRTLEPLLKQARSRG